VNIPNVLLIPCISSDIRASFVTPTCGPTLGGRMLYTSHLCRKDERRDE
jgi:hypothetical protein